MEFHVFDPHGDVSITRRRLPHWAQAGAYHFITFRTADSLPQTVLAAMADDRRRWLQGRGIDPGEADWKKRLAGLPETDRLAFRTRFSDAWQRALDAGHGDCMLRRCEVRQIVSAGLQHFDQNRYVLEAFVVMPNHVHLLAGFPAAGSVLGQCRSWKRFTAGRINTFLARTGPVWQAESWDHIVRTPESFERIRHYIAENPRRAGLGPREYDVYERARESG